MKLIISSGARRDIVEISDYIAQDSPRRAEALVVELEEACRALLRAPQAWPIVAGFERVSLRRRLYSPYIIFYLAHSDRVDIVRIVHGARDLDQLLARSIPR